MILVTGATGTVGGEVARALLRAGQPVRALVRAGGGSGLPDDVTTAEGDLNDPDSLAGALDGVEGLFLLAGFSDMPGVFAQAARAGLDRVVLLSSGAVVGGKESNAVTAYNMKSEAALRDSGVPGTVLRPSGFMANVARWGPPFKAGDTVHAPWADVPIAAIDTADIGAVAAKVVSEPGHEGVAYRLTGPEALKPAEQVAIIADVLGRELHFEGQPDDEARAQMSEAMPQEYVDAFFRYFADGEYDDSHVDPTLPTLLGRPARTFREWTEAHADELG